MPKELINQVCEAYEKKVAAFREWQEVAPPERDMLKKGALFEERLAQLEMREKILAGKAQADSGELLDGPDAMAAIGKRHGISI